MTTDLIPDLAILTRPEIDALAERLLIDVARQHGGMRQACTYYGIPVVLR